MANGAPLQQGPDTREEFRNKAVKPLPRVASALCVDKVAQNAVFATLQNPCTGPKRIRQCEEGGWQGRSLTYRCPAPHARDVQPLPQCMPSSDDLPGLHMSARMRDSVSDFMTVRCWD